MWRPLRFIFGGPSPLVWFIQRHHNQLHKDIKAAPDFLQKLILNEVIQDSEPSVQNVSLMKFKEAERLISVRSDSSHRWCFCPSGSISSCDAFLNVFQTKGLRADVICPCASSPEALTVAIRRYSHTHPALPTQSTNMQTRSRMQTERTRCRHVMITNIQIHSNRRSRVWFSP